MKAIEFHPLPLVIVEVGEPTVRMRIFATNRLEIFTRVRSPIEELIEDLKGTIDDDLRENES